LILFQLVQEWSVLLGQIGVNVLLFFFVRVWIFVTFHVVFVYVEVEFVDGTVFVDDVEFDDGLVAWDPVEEHPPDFKHQTHLDPYQTEKLQTAQQLLGGAILPETAPVEADVLVQPHDDEEQDVVLPQHCNLVWHVFDFGFGFGTQHLYIQDQLEQRDRKDDEANGGLDDRNACGAVEILGLDRVQHDAFDPPLPLFQEVRDGEGGLFLHDGFNLPEPLAFRAGHQRECIVLSDWVHQADVESDVTHDFRVDHQERPMHPEDWCANDLASHAESGEVISHSNAVCKSNEPVFRCFLFGINNGSIGEDWHHVFFLHVVVFLDAPVHYSVSIFDIKIRLFV